MTRQDALNFMDRQIMLAKPRYKLRKYFSPSARRPDWQTFVFYAEVSLYKNKFYFVLVNLNDLQSAMRQTPDKEWIDQVGTANSRANIPFSTSTTIIEVWKKQIQSMFMQNYYYELEKGESKLKAAQTCWTNLLKRI